MHNQDRSSSADSSDALSNFNTLIDNQSTVDVIVNTLLLFNMRRSQWTLVL